LISLKTYDILASDAETDANRNKLMTGSWACEYQHENGYSHERVPCRLSSGFFETCVSSNENKIFGGDLSVCHPLGTWPKMLIVQDKCIIKEHLCSSKQWNGSEGQNIIQPKDDGHARMLRHLSHVPGVSMQNHYLQKKSCSTSTCINSNNISVIDKGKPTNFWLSREIATISCVHSNCQSSWYPARVANCCPNMQNCIIALPNAGCRELAGLSGSWDDRVTKFDMGVMFYLMQGGNHAWHHQLLPSHPA